MKRIVSVMSVVSVVSALMFSLVGNAFAADTPAQAKAKAKAKAEAEAKAKAEAFNKLPPNVKSAISLGLTNATDVAALEATKYDPNTIVSLCLNNPTKLTACFSWHKPSLTDATTDALVKRLQDPAFPRNQAFLTVLRAIPPAKRAAVRDEIETTLRTTAPTTPVWNSVVAFPELLAGKPKQLTIDEIIAVLLAPEPNPCNAPVMKTTIKDMAILFARKALRAEGKTFVVSTNGVNPLVAKLEPVVAALNAPCLIGLESALGNIGMDVKDHDRTPLQVYADKLKEDVLAGTKTLSVTENGKLVIALGVEGFNKFVDLYNKGAN